MRTHSRHRQVRFDGVDGCLVRIVTDQTTGKVYQQGCSRQTFEAVARFVGGTPRQGDGTTLRQIVQSLNLPYTQVDVALRFLDERGLVGIRHRRFYPASVSTYEDAMTEFCFLAEAPY